MLDLPDSDGIKASLAAVRVADFSTQVFVSLTKVKQQGSVNSKCYLQGQEKRKIEWENTLCEEIWSEVWSLKGN